jgi:hypothetical protein
LPPEYEQSLDKLRPIFREHRDLGRFFYLKARLHSFHDCCIVDDGNGGLTMECPCREEGGHDLKTTVAAAGVGVAAGFFLCKLFSRD